MNDEKELKGIEQLIAESKENHVEEKSAPRTGGDAVLATQVEGTPDIQTEEVTEKFEKKMKEIRLKELEKEAEQKASSQGYDYIDLVGFPISDTAISSIPKEIAEREKVVCFFNNEKEVRLGALAPTSVHEGILQEVIQKHTVDGSGKIYLISKNSFTHALKNYDRIPELKKFEYGVEITGDDLERLRPLVSNFGNLNARLNTEKNMTELFALIVAGSLEAGSSDIHIEAQEKVIQLRYRIDGVMHEVSKLEKDLWKRLDARIKTIAGLKINVTEKPQDGRITIYLGENDKLDLRVSTLPTAFGESIVMRLLKSNVTSLSFDDLGLRGKSYENLKTAVEKTTGMVVTTGPTGSGKTTTLYAMLNKLNDGKTKIITLEDPIEFKLAGIAQSQIDHSKGYSFADGLRSLMRQDPDIIMVGELRDIETADVAIDASLTGHKVISTIHTNDAAGAVPRFLSMGVKPFLLAPALNAVVGQRLLRKICDSCKVPHTPEAYELEKAARIMEQLPENSGHKKIDLSQVHWLRGGGCEECQHIGYKGRLGIFEIFLMNKEFESMILSGKVSSYDMAEIARKYGMITMQQDGILKAIEGLTTLEEIFRVAG
jgi:type II secretory ATPase GspE/PulE/Tfp pilus assembly ATPase PilB-like protein